MRSMCSALKRIGRSGRSSQGLLPRSKAGLKRSRTCLWLGGQLRLRPDELWRTLLLCLVLHVPCSEIKS